MQLSKDQSKKLKERLPSRYVGHIQHSLNEKEIVVSDSTIVKVINGDIADSYGIIDIAMEWAEDLEKINAQRKKRLSKL